MNIRNTIRTLAAAALLAVTVVTVSAEHADARPRRIPTVKEESCAMDGAMVGSSNDYEFYRPGAYVRDIYGGGWVCRPNGFWTYFGTHS